MFTTPEINTIGFAKLFNLESHPLGGPMGCIDNRQTCIAKKFQQINHVYLGTWQVAEYNSVYIVISQPPSHFA